MQARKEELIYHNETHWLPRIPLSGIKLWSSSPLNMVVRSPAWNHFHHKWADRCFVLKYTIITWGSTISSTYHSTLKLKVKQDWDQDTSRISLVFMPKSHIHLIIICPDEASTHLSSFFLCQVITKDDGNDFFFLSTSVSFTLFLTFVGQFIEDSFSLGHFDCMEATCFLTHTL